MEDNKKNLEILINKKDPKKESKIPENIKTILEYLFIVIVVVLIRSFWVTPVQVDGPSMEPTLYDNEILLLNKLDYKQNGLKRFDIIVFKYKNISLIKRVIAFPGEHVAFKENELYINGKKITEKFKRDYTYDFDLTDINLETVPEDTYFVMGDNRNNSNDSRLIGPVPSEQITGKISFMIWPWRSISL